jgi:hypothetical protein
MVVVLESKSEGFANETAISGPDSAVPGKRHLTLSIIYKILKIEVENPRKAVLPEREPFAPFGQNRGCRSSLKR